MHRGLINGILLCIYDVLSRDNYIMRSLTYKRINPLMDSLYDAVIGRW
jgi:hypothetical protein